MATGLTSEAPKPEPSSGDGRIGTTWAWRSPRAWLIVILVFSAALGLDLWSKSWSFRNVAGRPIILDRERLIADPAHDPIGWHPTYALLPGDLLDFKLVLNPGAVFGVAAHKRWFFVAFTGLAMLAGLVVFGRHTRAHDRVAHVALALILAGGMGNLYDRLVFGRVRDFLHMLPGRLLPEGWTWPGTNNPELCPWVFNVADLALLLGIILLLIHLKRTRPRQRGDEAPAAEPA